MSGPGPTGSRAGGLVLHAHGLVGRKAELEEIERFLDTVSEGPGALVVEGDPGIGKTELWTAALAAARGRRARCVPRPLRGAAAPRRDRRRAVARPILRRGVGVRSAPTAG